MVVSMQKWRGKVAVVTGASAGIGAAVAEALVNAGLKVAGIGRRKDKIESISQKLQCKPGRLYAVQADVTDEEEITAAFQWITTNLGPIHILINSAGLTQDTTLVDGDAEKWKKVFDTNVIGLSMVTREAIKDMRKNDVDGHVVHINSVLGHFFTYVPRFNVYNASKHAVTALTETLRQELTSLGSKIKITSISPGPVDTEFPEAAGFTKSEDFKRFYQEMPKLLAEDIADAVVYALSTPPHVQVHEVMLRPVGGQV